VSALGNPASLLLGPRPGGIAPQQQLRNKPDNGYMPSSDDDEGGGFVFIDDATVGKLAGGISVTGGNGRKRALPGVGVGRGTASMPAADNAANPARSLRPIRAASWPPLST
jgi:hypothetical protein